MFEIFLVLIVLVLVCGLCLHHHNMKKILTEATKHDRDVVREAADDSMKAVHIRDPFIAHEISTEALQKVKSLQSRYGTTIASDITGIDIQEIQSALQHQRNSIRKENFRLRKYDAPASLNPVNYPLSFEAGYINEQSRVLQNPILQTQ